VGPFGIELLDEIIEAGLLLEAVEAWRPRGFLLQGEMHAFVPAVLLGLARLDALDLDAEPEPPDGELGEIEQGIGAGKGDAVVAADGSGQAAFFEEALESGEGQLFPGGFKRFTQQQIARGVIGDSEGIAVGLVAELELALVIGAPQVVWRCPGDSAVPLALWRGLPMRLTNPWRSRTAWMVLIAGTPTSPARRRTRSSRILRAPQCGLSRFRLTIKLATWRGNWLA
jgi:hypothetical protein